MLAPSHVTRIAAVLLTLTMTACERGPSSIEVSESTDVLANQPALATSALQRLPTAAPDEKVRQPPLLTPESPDRFRGEPSKDLELRSGSAFGLLPPNAHGPRGALPGAALRALHNQGVQNPAEVLRNQRSTGKADFGASPGTLFPDDTADSEGGMTLNITIADDYDRVFGVSAGFSLHQAPEIPDTVDVVDEINHILSPTMIGGQADGDGGGVGCIEAGIMTADASDDPGLFFFASDEDEEFFFWIDWCDAGETFLIHVSSLQQDYVRTHWDTGDPTLFPIILIEDLDSNGDFDTVLYLYNWTTGEWVQQDAQDEIEHPDPDFGNVNPWVFGEYLLWTKSSGDYCPSFSETVDVVDYSYYEGQDWVHPEKSSDWTRIEWRCFRSPWVVDLIEQSRTQSWFELERFFDGPSF